LNQIADLTIEPFDKQRRRMNALPDEPIFNRLRLFRISVAEAIREIASGIRENTRSGVRQF
jgi:hypothetical protein